MEVKIIKVYSMWHAEKQCQLTLALGHVVDCEGNKALRWKLKGSYIPFPVRSNTWFVGFDSGTMLGYLDSFGYKLDAIANMKTGDISVFPRVETEVNVVEPCVDDADVLFKKDVCRVAREYNKIVAACLVKHLYGIGLRYATNTVDKWLDECSQP